ncbi:MAG TPA: Rad52/Rad22 family DNA repair protein [Longimicrobium sp.]|nr:Rad52/Rad22 family DNA repair protein [Longimicrobium sp.]
MAEIDFQALQEFFEAEAIEWRIQHAGEKNGRAWAICVPYVTNRAIQSRLDQVVGPENWRNEFRPGPDGGVMCGLSIRVGEEWVTKWDGAENTDVEGVKGGLSGAMKRAAVQWGIGRYLYTLDETFAHVHDNGRFRGKLPDKLGGRSFRWDPPELPAAVLPAGRPDAAASAAAAAASAAHAPGAEHDAMLEFVRSVGPRVDETAQIRINRRVRNLREFVRENWAAIKEQPRIARAVVEAIEHATGTPFHPARRAA